MQAWSEGWRDGKLKGGDDVWSDILDSNTSNSNNNNNNNNNNSSSSSWIPSPTASYGLEIQSPWSSKILSKTKTIETRKYPLPPQLLNKKIAILETEEGKAGVSGLKDTVSCGGGGGGVRRRGWVVFEEVKIYKNEQAFSKDEARHLCVKGGEGGGGGYEWSGVTVYGWVVKACGEYDEEEEKVSFSFQRKFRSLFEKKNEKNEVEEKTTKKGKGKGKSRGKREQLDLGGEKKKKKRY